MHVQSNLKALRTAIPYIRAYKGQIFVVKLSGQMCTPGKTLDNLVDQIALLYQLRIRIVVVHGGGDQADALCRRLGAEPRRFAGRRITDDAALEVAKMAFAGTVNTDLLAAMRKARLPAVGLSGIDADLLTARRRPPQATNDPSTGQTREIDFGHVGDIVDVSPRILKHLLMEEYVPVVCSLAADADGNVLNVNADTVASRIAVELGAAKYFLITRVDGVMRSLSDPGSLLPLLDLRQLEELVAAGAVSGGMLPKLAACRAALLGGVPKVHIVNGLTPDTLLGEVFTNEGCGTLLVEKHAAARTAEPVTVAS